MATSTNCATESETDKGAAIAVNLGRRTSMLRVLVARHQAIRRDLCKLADAISERNQLESSGRYGAVACDLHRAEFRIAEALLAILDAYASTDELLDGACQAGVDDDDIPF